jgi:hypothetical protein
MDTNSMYVVVLGFNDESPELHSLEAAQRWADERAATECKIFVVTPGEPKATILAYRPQKAS